MRTKSCLLLSLGFVSAVLAGGCATSSPTHAYKGTPLPPSELALIVGTTQQTYNVLSPSRERVSIAAIDDRSTVPWYSMSSLPTAAYVQPGRRKVDVLYEHVHGVANGTVWVDTVAARTYQIKVMNPERRTTRVYFVVEDITAQTLVGGAEQAPSATPPAE